MPDAPWLPAGGWADVVLTGPGDPLPDPVGLVRLLVTDADGRIFCVPRTGGRPGWDLPTAPVPDGDALAALHHLTRVVLGRASGTELVGFVRNTVPEGTRYEWPSPVAHFTVHRPTAPGLAPVVDGTWLDRAEAPEHLSERHWWPLVAVDHDSATAIRDELLIAWGHWLDGGERDRDRVLGAATAALVLGLDSPALRELAGLYPDATWSEVDGLIVQAATELHMPRPTKNLALRTELEHLARQVVRGETDPEKLTAWAYRRVGHNGPQELLTLVRLDDDYAMLEDVTGYWEVRDRPEAVRALDGVVHAAAAAILAGETDLSRFMPVRWRR